METTVDCSAFAPGIQGLASENSTRPRVIDRLLASDWLRPSTAAVQQVPVTLFDNKWGKTKREELWTLSTIAMLVQVTVARGKDDLPLLKLARFGNIRSDKGSLRHNDNVLAVTGCEGDYDGEKVPFEEVCEASDGSEY